MYPLGLPPFQISKYVTGSRHVCCQMFDVYLRAYKDTRLAKQLTKQIIDNMLSRLHIGGRAFAERYVGLRPTCCFHF